MNEFPADHPLARSDETKPRPLQKVGDKWCEWCGCGAPGGKYVVRIAEGPRAGTLMLVHERCITKGR